MSLINIDERKIQTVNKLKDTGKGIMLVGKRTFLNNVGLLLSVRGKICNNFTGSVIPTKNLESVPKPAKERT